MAKAIAPVPRATFVTAWLSVANMPQYTKFVATKLVEKANARAQVQKALGETVFIHHHFPDILRKNLAALGYPEAAKELDARPKAHRTRMGNFGEVVATEVLRQLKGYEVPVYRLRYNMNPDSALKGDDILAFEFEDPERKTRGSVIVAEVKARATHNASAVSEAHDALENGHCPRAKSLPFVVNALRLEHRDDLADRILPFLNKFRPRPYTKKSVLFLVTGNDPRDPFACLEQASKVVKHLETFHLYLDDLTNLVDLVMEQDVNVDEL